MSPSFENPKRVWIKKHLRWTCGAESQFAWVANQVTRVTSSLPLTPFAPFFMAQRL